jgi:hypothetical protein
LRSYSRSRWSRLPTTRACKPSLGMKAHVICLVNIRDLHRDGLRGLETFRRKYVLNVVTPLVLLAYLAHD